ncbi:hypothetical protein KDH_77080 [Dictyobacter sp. S3.2.2.5]|uniref:Uncharacterized protein n=1 Tax=Dictyobacter halimunensis TaxID=3026934 RepID=A0ABQ6G2Z3_9CHLR|nr:hypothetical protein KDH_77080 [Dictyobacter sp. S3.2.2.5]
MERLLTSDEIYTLAREHKILDQWKKVHQLATTICGDRAHKVVAQIIVRNATKTFPGTHYVAIYDKEDQLIWGDGVFPLAISTQKILQNPDYLDARYRGNHNFARDKDALFARFPPFDVLYQKQSPLTSFSAADLAEYGTYHVEWLDQPPPLSFPNAYIKEGDSHRHTLKPAEVMKLAEMHRDYLNWGKIRKIVHAAYGPQASIATVQSYPMYDDDSGYYSLAQLKEVLDRSGNILQPDPTLPAWQNGDIFKSSFPYEPGEIQPQTFYSSSYDRPDIDYPSFVGGLSTSDLRYHINNFFDYAGIFTSHTCNLDQPPVVPPAVYAHIED